MTKTLITMLSLLALSTYSIANDIPVVPISVMKRDVPKPVVVEKKAPGLSKSANLVMQPGVNQIIPIAVGHPNRIVTPFQHPSVTSTTLQASLTEGECGEVCIKDNVIYIATNQEHPVTMFITESGSEARALSLTMVPQRIPPREVFLEMDGNHMLQTKFANKKAQKWEQSQPYIEAIKGVFRHLALSEIPSGYTLQAVPSNKKRPICKQPGFDIDFNAGQMMTGHYLTVFIGIAKNVTNEHLEFKEQYCGQWNVAAVTAWPLKVLAPGERTEVYVAMKEQPDILEAQHRPSLLGSN